MIVSLQVLQHLQMITNVVTMSKHLLWQCHHKYYNNVKPLAMIVSLQTYNTVKTLAIAIVLTVLWQLRHHKYYNSVKHLL